MDDRRTSAASAASLWIRFGNRISRCGLLPPGTDGRPLSPSPRRRGHGGCRLRRTGRPPLHPGDQSPHRDISANSPISPNPRGDAERKGMSAGQLAGGLGEYLGVVEKRLSKGKRDIYKTLITSGSCLWGNFLYGVLHRRRILTNHSICDSRSTISDQ